MSKSGDLKFLIAGLGSIGRRHLENLLAFGYRDIILYRTGKSTLEDVGHGLPVFHDLASAFAEKPDAVIISNPTALHMPVAEAAANASAHIFLEKPISHTVDSLRMFETVLQTSASRVFVAYQFRFNAGLVQIKSFLDTQALGKPVSFISRWGEYLPDWHPWEDYRESYAARSALGGGVVLTLSHPIDYLRWFFGDVVELSAKTGNRSELELDCEDFADARLIFRNSVSGDLHLDYYSKPKVHYLEITCESGEIHWDYDSNIVTIHKNGREIESFPPPDGYGRNDMYLNELSHFIDVINGDAEPVCTYADGKKVLQVALGILQSGRYHDRVIFED